MRIRSLIDKLVLALLCSVFAAPAPAQSFPGGGHIGPTKGEVAGILIGAGAGIGLGTYFIYRSVHKGSSVEGCVASDGGNLTLRNKNNETYTLTGNLGDLKPGEHVTLQGKKVKAGNSSHALEVRKVAQNYGACTR